MNDQHQELQVPPMPPPGFVPTEPTGDMTEWRRRQYSIINWSEFWTEELPERQWLVEGLIQRGQQGVIYSLPGIGKSLLALELGVLLALGETTLGRSKVEPIKVLYIDQENSHRDVFDRLTAFGFGRDTDLTNLQYSLLGDWPALNTKQGGEDLVRYCQAEGIGLVIMDTTSRVVEGDFNNANTITDLWKYAQVHLKREGVSVIRIDHAGKQADRGQLGSVMKGADQDVIWRMDRGDGSSVVLVCEKDRAGAVEVGHKILLRRSSEPLRHVVQDATQDAFDLIDEENRILDALDREGVPLDAGRDTCLAALRSAGVATPSTARMSEIVKQRKAGGGVPG